jgi:hypothetical protein
MASLCLSLNSATPSLATATFKADSTSIAFLKISRSHVYARLFGVIAYFDCHVTSLLESDWRALYSARGHGPYRHLTRPFLPLLGRRGWRARLILYMYMLLSALCVGRVGVKDLTITNTNTNVHRYTNSSGIHMGFRSQQNY